MRRKQLGISSLIALCCYQWIGIGVQHHHVNIVSSILFKELVLRLIKEGWRCGFQWCGVCGYIEIRWYLKARQSMPKRSLSWQKFDHGIGFTQDASFNVLRHSWVANWWICLGESFCLTKSKEKVRSTLNLTWIPPFILLRIYLVSNPNSNRRNIPC